MFTIQIYITHLPLEGISTFSRVYLSECTRELARYGGGSPAAGTNTNAGQVLSKCQTKEKSWPSRYCSDMSFSSWSFRKSVVSKRRQLGGHGPKMS